jgi:hypothetical protein
MIQITLDIIVCDKKTVLQKLSHCSIFYEKNIAHRFKGKKNLKKTFMSPLYLPNFYEKNIAHRFTGKKKFEKTFMSPLYLPNFCAPAEKRSCLTNLVLFPSFFLTQK